MIEIIKQILNLNILRNLSWDLPNYFIVSALVLILIQPLSLYLNFCISKIILVNTSVLMITICFINSIYFEYITNSKYSKEFKVYTNEVHKLKQNILCFIVYTLNLVSIFLTYVISSNINIIDIISLIFILSIYFIPIFFFMISSVKNSLYLSIETIKNIIYQDKNILSFYTDVEVCAYIKLYLKHIRSVYGKDDESFERIIARKIYNELINNKEIKI